MPSLTGGVIGLSIALMSNGVRKLPLMRQPWDHVLYFCVGLYAGDQYNSLRERTIKELAEAEADMEKRAAERAARFAKTPVAASAPIES